MGKVFGKLCHLHVLSFILAPATYLFVRQFLCSCVSGMGSRTLDGTWWWPAAGWRPSTTQVTVIQVCCYFSASSSSAGLLTVGMAGISVLLSCGGLGASCGPCHPEGCLVLGHIRRALWRKSHKTLGLSRTSCLWNWEHSLHQGVKKRAILGTSYEPSLVYAALVWGYFFLPEWCYLQLKCNSKSYFLNVT